jgi:hypothetical protein
MTGRIRPNPKHLLAAIALLGAIGISTLAAARGSSHTVYRPDADCFSADWLGRDGKPHSDLARLWRRLRCHSFKSPSLTASQTQQSGAQPALKKPVEGGKDVQP